MPEPTAPRPDVPDDLLTLAADAHEPWHIDNRTSDEFEVYRSSHEAWVRATLAAVLPAHERQVREQVADEIEARVAEHRSEAARLDLGDRADMLESIGVLAKADHLAEGARIARGES